MGRRINLLLFKNVSNMGDISDLLLDGRLEAAVLTPKYVFHPEQLLVAAHRSLFLQSQEQLQTKTVFAEVLYNLYPGRSIRDALRTFGARRDDREAAFVVFDDASGAAAGRVAELVDGEPLSFDDVSQVNDVPSILDLYKIPSHAADDDTLQFILTRMAARDVL